jgi:hypothetical protein
MTKADQLESTKVVSDSGGSLVLDSIVGDGAEGCVYSIKNNSDNVVKIFQRNKRNKLLDTPAGKRSYEQKIEAMVASPPVDPTKNEKNIQSIVWPTDIIRDTGNSGFLGYKMARKDMGKYSNIQKYIINNLKWNASSGYERFTVATNLASSVAVIHKQDHAIGDLNHDNILVGDGYVTLIDCDSYHISGNDTVYPGNTVYHRYTQPGGRGDSIDEVKRDDMFGLGIHVFQVLMDGLSPFQAAGQDSEPGDMQDAMKNPFPYEDSGVNINPPRYAPNYEELPPEVRGLFQRCFIKGKYNADVRPSAEEWFRSLKRAREHLPQSTTNSTSSGSTGGTFQSNNSTSSGSTGSTFQSNNSTSWDSADNTFQSNNTESEDISDFTAASIWILGPLMFIFQIVAAFAYPSIASVYILLISFGISCGAHPDDRLTTGGVLVYVIVTPATFLISLFGGFILPFWATVYMGIVSLTAFNMVRNVYS